MSPACFCRPDEAFAPQVEELRRDLRIKSQELEVKNAAANDKLKKMVKDQQEAEKKKVPLPVLGIVACVGRASPSPQLMCVCVHARVCVEWVRTHARTCVSRAA